MSKSLQEKTVPIASCTFLEISNTDRNLPYVIFGIPYERHSSVRRGAKFGPWAIREISRYVHTFDLNTRVDIRDKLVDIGDIKICSTVKDDFEKELNQIENFVHENVTQNQFPIVLGGDHLITLPVFKGLIKDQTSCILHFDAHMDLYDRYPYITAANESYTHATVFRRIIESGIDQVISIGIRSVDPLEFDYFKSEERIQMISSYDLHKEGTGVIGKKIEKFLEPFEWVYLSLDLDVFDPAYAPGVSTPEPYGISPWEFLQLLDSFCEKLTGFDVVELCPPFDNGITSTLAVKTIVDILCRHEKSRY
ncbi:MAG: agmatinase [Promethearchaeota archaeon]